MSATGQVKRIPADAYPTPNWCVDRLFEVPRVRALLTNGRWLEPAVGGGAITRAVDWNAVGYRYSPPSWTFCDLDRTLEPDNDNRWLPRNYLGNQPSVGTFDVGITNPPFSLAFRFIKRMYHHCGHVLVLTRLNLLGGQARADWLRDHTPAVYVLPSRPSFGHKLMCAQPGVRG